MLDVLVIDKAKAKEPFARQMGASAFLDPADPDLVRTVRELTDGIGVDVAFECVGSPVALRTAVEVTGGGGTICVAGIFPAPFEFDLNALLMQEKSIVTSLGYSDEFPMVIAMLADGRLAAEPLITRTVSLAEGVEIGLNKYEDISVTNIRTLIRIES
jgi:(R,R)-butanediol dehydrogenase/meso-butanediol dehydrogenase/diacetyl reductase